MSVTKFTFTPEPFERVRTVGSNVNNRFGSTKDSTRIFIDFERVGETSKETRERVETLPCTAISVVLE
jgi:hypothetical protein